MAKQTDNPHIPSFWEHLDDLRTCIIRTLVVIMILSVVVFLFKDTLFHILLGPSRGDFITYRILGIQQRDIALINTDLAKQLNIHIYASLCCGVMIGSPWILKEIFGFIQPALYEKERHYTLLFVTAAYIMFLLGVIVNYFIIFPMMAHFLGNYQVSLSVPNFITLSSYIGALTTSTLTIGALFELPIVSWVMGRCGLLKASWMKHYRRHAIVIIMIVAAIITPADAISLCIVALPIWLLYEASIIIVDKTHKRKDCCFSHNKE